jgi:hypothetical protein
LREQIDEILRSAQKKADRGGAKRRSAPSVRGGG